MSKVEYVLESNELLVVGNVGFIRCMKNYELSWKPCLTSSLLVLSSTTLLLIDSFLASNHVIVLIVLQDDDDIMEMTMQTIRQRLYLTQLQMSVSIKMHCDNR